MSFDHTDYSFVVKNRASPPKQWRWEIYRAGKNSPLEWSPIFFQTMASAQRAGKAALARLLSDLYPDRSSERRELS